MYQHDSDVMQLLGFQGLKPGRETTVGKKRRNFERGEYESLM